MDVLISSGLKSLSVPVGKVFWEVKKHANCAGTRRPVIALVTYRFGLKVFVKIDFHIKDKEEQGIEQRPPMMIEHVCYGCILWLLYAMTKYIVDKEISRTILWSLGRDCRCKKMRR